MAAVASPLGDVCSTMTAEVITDGQSGRVFIARHGERADFADEDWLKQAEVTCDALTTNSMPATAMPQQQQLRLPTAGSMPGHELDAGSTIHAFLMTAL